jgi:hypothetical protein
MIHSYLSYLQGLLIAFTSGVIYYVAYQVNAMFDSWVAYAQGISLIFLPAGIKHISILTGGKWGALGCLIALFFVASSIWDTYPVSDIATFCLISIGATWLGILVAMTFLGIDDDLSNLKFIHLPLMDLITTLIHSLTTNTYLIFAGITSEHFWGNSFAMMAGDYVGCFIILTFLFLGVRIKKKLQNTSS